MRLLPVEEVAKALDVSRQTVMRMIQEKQLPAICIRSGRRKKVWRIREEQLERWVSAKEKESTARGARLTSVKL